ESTLGKRWSAPYDDVRNSRLVILWGHNPIATAPHFMPFLREAQHNGCRLVVIDPRRTPSATGADLHLAIRPGTDALLAMRHAGPGRTASSPWAPPACSSRTTTTTRPGSRLTRTAGPPFASASHSSRSTVSRVRPDWRPNRSANSLISTAPSVLV